MRTRAVAVASERSNAIGAVELECTPLGLLVVYHGVGAFQDGYAPGAITQGTRVLVPWASVSEAGLEADRLFVHVDEGLTPHNRLMLAGFSSGDPPNPSELRRRRLVVRIGTFAAMAVGGLLVAVTMARFSTDSGAAAAVLLGCFAAALVFFVGTIAEQRLGLGGIESDGVRLAFATELSLYVPSLARTMQPASAHRPVPAAPPLTWPSFQELLPRSTTAVVITMSAALFGAVLTASWVSRAPTRAAATGDDSIEPERAAAPAHPPPDEEPAPAAAVSGAVPEIATKTAAAAAPANEPKASGDAAPLTSMCRCGRADSLLWRDGIPRMSIVLIDKKSKQHKGHPHLDLEVGVVNNWAEPIAEVRLLVQFFERDPPPSKKRTPTFDRPLYFEGPLEPGQAIKWHAEARGDDFEITGPPETMLDESGSDAAAANLFAELLAANHRPIRLHGAMMLAYLGDPRAKDGALALREALREDEAPYIDRLTWTLSDVRTCALSVKAGAGPREVRTCVFNASKEPRDHLAIKLRALDRPFRYDTPIEPPPLVVAEHAWKLDGQLRAGEGAFASLAFGTENPDGITPQAFEATADNESVIF